jgi:hypothetical protein
LSETELVTVTLENCRLCKGSHTYRLKVERKLSSAKEKESEKPKKRMFGKVLVCPATGKKFPGALTLFETLDRKIKAVEVLGLG